MKKITGNNFVEIELTKEAYYSMDNTVEYVIYSLAKEFMDAVGNQKYKQYKNHRHDGDDIDKKHSKNRIKIYKKIRNAINKIDAIIHTNNGVYDCIIHNELSIHTNTLFKYRHILSY